MLVNPLKKQDEEQKIRKKLRLKFIYKIMFGLTFLCVTLDSIFEMLDLIKKLLFFTMVQSINYPVYILHDQRATSTSAHILIVR